MEKGMEGQNRFERMQRNPRTHAEHHREVFWQITLPLIVGILVILAAMAAIIFSAVQPVTDLGRWADVSLMWLIMPSLFLALLILVVLIGFIYLTVLLLRLIPRYTFILQMYFEIGRDKISQVSNLVVEPILKWSSVKAALGRFGKRDKVQVDEG